MKDFDQILEMTARGNNAAVDMLVGDIYGGRDYESIGLSATTIASSFGKVQGPTAGMIMAAHDLPTVCILPGHDSRGPVRVSGILCDRAYCVPGRTAVLAAFQCGPQNKRCCCWWLLEWRTACYALL